MTWPLTCNAVQVVLLFNGRKTSSEARSWIEKINGKGKGSNNKKIFKKKERRGEERRLQGRDDRHGSTVNLAQ